MKTGKPLLLCILLAATGCSQEAMEEFAFRKSLQLGLEETCATFESESTQQRCIEDVAAQVKPCMEGADWRRYLGSEDDPGEQHRFSQALMGCIVTADGKPWFEIDEPAVAE